MAPSPRKEAAQAVYDKSMDLLLMTLDGLTVISNISKSLYELEKTDTDADDTGFVLRRLWESKSPTADNLVRQSLSKVMTLNEELEKLGATNEERHRKRKAEEDLERVAADIAAAENQTGGPVLEQSRTTPVDAGTQTTPGAHDLTSDDAITALKLPLNTKTGDASVDIATATPKDLDSNEMVVVLKALLQAKTASAEDKTKAKRAARLSDEEMLTLIKLLSK